MGMVNPKMEDLVKARDALTKAIDEGRPSAGGAPWTPGGVCTCVVIAEALGMEKVTKPPSGELDSDRERAANLLYAALRRRGFDPERLYVANDTGVDKDVDVRSFRADRGESAMRAKLTAHRFRGGREIINRMIAEAEAFANSESLTTV